MSRVTIIKNAEAIPEGAALDGIRRFLFGFFDGWRKDDKSGWRKIWRRLMDMEPGEFAVIEFVIPRSGPYHRRHFAILSAVFDSQERFDDFERFRDWLSIGAGHVTWVPGAKGGIVPLPKSIRYSKADQAEFEAYHAKVMAFLRGEHAARFLWRHLGDEANSMIETIFDGFGE